MKDYKLCNRNVVNSAKTCCKGNREVLFRRTSACDALMTKCMGCHSWPCYFFHQVMILKQGKLSFSQKIREDSLFSSTRAGHRHSLQPQRWKILKHRWQGENPFNIHFSWRTYFMTMLISSLLPRPPILLWKWPSTADLVPQLADGSEQIQIGLLCSWKIWNLEYWLCPLIANLRTNHNALLPGIVVFQPRVRGSSIFSNNSQSARHVCPKTQSRA